jgi:cystathionine beta-lyase/cystathionine gamma-synthase
MSRYISLEPVDHAKAKSALSRLNYMPSQRIVGTTVWQVMCSLSGLESGGLLQSGANGRARALRTIVSPGGQRRNFQHQVVVRVGFSVVSFVAQGVMLFICLEHMEVKVKVKVQTTHSTHDNDEKKYMYRKRTAGNTHLSPNVGY